MALSILRPVTVKAIVTDQLRAGLLVDLRKVLENAEREIQQLDFQGKKMLLDLERRNPERTSALQQQLEAERQKRLDGKKELLQKLQAVLALQLGQEVIHSTVEGVWTLEIGQSWSAVQGVEIVLKDDIVVEIRGLQN